MVFVKAGVLFYRMVLKKRLEYIYLEILHSHLMEPKKF